MKYYFIINPEAGAEDAPRRLVPKIDGYFNEHGLERTIYLTEYKGHAKELAKQIAEKGETCRICACGGDGTLNEVVSGAAEHENVEIAFIPCGSGNDFIKCFGPVDAFNNLDVVVTGTSVPVDLMKINNDKYCMNIFSVGVDADVAAGIPKWRRVPLCGGHTAYNLSLIECMMKPVGKYLTVDGKPNNLTIVAVCNGKVYGGGYIAAPEAKYDDGLLDIISVKKLSKLKIASVISLYKVGKHISNGKVAEDLNDIIEFRRGESIRIEAPIPFSANIDGEIEKMTTADIAVIPAGFRFVIPD